MSFRKRIPGRPASAAFGLAVLLAVAACETTIDVRGHVPDDENLAKIQVGLQSKRDVAELLGTPSTVTPFGDETWLYISRKTSTVSFMEPKTLEQKVVAVAFDDKGRVADVRKLELADGKVVRHVARKTPAPGKELSFIEQLIGNVGKFNAPRPSAVGGPAGGGL
jgi:outer membrane protein assembly factor BamE (lipoprotein component of BamABCDE complex)